MRVLNFAWHNVEWPPVESLIGEASDVAFSPHPLLLPARHAAQVVMVHDLDFLKHPERAAREIRRDYPRLAASHARRARRVIVPSAFTADEVRRLLGVPGERISVCPPGIPDWTDPIRTADRDGYLLFMGTLEPRKNIPGLLAAYRTLLEDGVHPPKLVLAGRAVAASRPYLDAIGRPPLAGRVEHIGYVADEARQRTYAGACALILPSLEEGFGMPALEAMSLGIPVVASARGAVPEVMGDAGLLVDPDDPRALPDALARLLNDTALAASLAERGLVRARGYRWSRTATAVHDAFAAAIAAHTA